MPHWNPAHALAATSGAPGSPLPMARVARLGRHLRGELTVVVVYAAALGVLTLATPIAVQVLINTIAFTGLKQPVVVVSLLLAAGLAMAALFQAAQTVAVESISQRVFVETALNFARSLAGASPQVHAQKDLRRLSNNFYDVVTVEKTTWSLLFEGPTAVLQILVGLTLLAFYHPFLLLFGAGLSLASLFIIFALGRGAIATALKESTLKHKLAARLQEIGHHPELFSSSQGRQFAVHRIADEANGWLNVRQSHFRIVLGQMIGFWGLQAVGSAALLMAGGSLVVAGQLTLGQLVAAELVMATTAASLAKIGRMLPKFYDLTAALVKLATVAELAQEEPSKIKQQGSHALGLLATCPATDETATNAEPAWQFRIAPQALQIVTGTREGLARLRDMILRRILAPGVRLAVDGTPIELWDPAVLRDRVHLLTGQWLPGKDILAQTRLGLEHIRNEEVHAALAWAGLEDLLVQWQQQSVDSAVFDHSPLDDVQTVLLAFARAWLAKPGMVLCFLNLDGLPLDKQQHLLARLHDERCGWTALVFTQDPRLLAQGEASATLPSAIDPGAPS